MAKIDDCPRCGEKLTNLPPVRDMPGPETPTWTWCSKCKKPYSVHYDASGAPAALIEQDGTSWSWSPEDRRWVR